jgi:hypothetical protein
LFWKKSLRLRAYLGGMLKGNDATTWAEEEAMGVATVNLGPGKGNSQQTSRRTRDSY